MYFVGIVMFIFLVNVIIMKKLLEKFGMSEILDVKKIVMVNVVR